MKKKITYEKDPFGPVTLGERLWKGRLPTPQEIARAEQTTKITLSVSTPSLHYLKAQAEQLHIPYQTMIRRLLDAYVAQAGSTQG